MVPKSDQLMHEVLNNFHAKILHKIQGMIVVREEKAKLYLYKQVAQLMDKEEKYIRQHCKGCIEGNNN